MSLMSLAVAGKFFTAKSHSQWLRLLGSIWEYFLCMQISQYLNRDVLLHHPLFIFLATLVAQHCSMKAFSSCSA